METSDNITVIVPTRNDACHIRAFLSSLPSQVGLIVVDNSDDETPNLVAAHRPANTRLMCLPTCNVTEARQLGAESARSDWLLFTDANVTFATDYFLLLPDRLTADAVYGAKLTPDDCRRDSQWSRRGLIVIDRLGFPAATGSNLLIRREVFHAIGGFDLTLAGDESSEIAWRIRRNGYRTRFAPDLIVYTCTGHLPDQGRDPESWYSLARSALAYRRLLPVKRR